MHTVTSSQVKVVIEFIPGMKLLYTPTGMIITIHKVGKRNVSWYVGHVYKRGSGKNLMRMTHQSIKTTVEGIENGIYKIIRKKL